MQFDAITFRMMKKSNHDLVLRAGYKIPSGRKNIVPLAETMSALYGTNKFIQKVIMSENERITNRHRGLFHSPEVEPKEILFRESRRKLNSGFPVECFAVIEYLVNRGRALTTGEINLVQFLERSIEVYFPFFSSGRQIVSRVSVLRKLRHKSTKRFNTVCYKCGAPLRRTGTVTKNKPTEEEPFRHEYNPSRCYRSENRKCFDGRLNLKGQVRSQLDIKPCDRCGVWTRVFQRRIHEKLYWFCSEKHYEAKRKALNRSR